MKKIFLLLTILTFAITSTVSAQGTTNLDIDNNIGLEQIRIPFFSQMSLPSGEHATILSWVTFIANVAIIGLIAFWVFLILRAAFQALKSEGDEEGMKESFNKVKSLFIGVGITFLIPIVLSVIGGFLGLGNMWSWPAALRNCPNGSYNYYYQATLNAPDGTEPKAWANQYCFG